MVAKSPLWKLFYSDKKKYKNNKTHYNAWCTGCLDEEIRALKFTHAAAVARGEAMVAPHEDFWFQLAVSSIEPICGKTESMMSHKRRCKRIDQELRKQVDDELAHKIENPAGSDYVQPASIPALRYTPVIPREYYQNSLPSSQLLSPLSDITADIFSSANSSITPPPKRARQSGPLSENELTFFPPSDQVHRQHEFNQDIIRLLCSCELLFYLLERPQFRHFIMKWIPNVQLPDRCTASESLLNKECERIISQTKDRIGGKFASYQCDGWKNVAKTAVVSSMILVENEPIPIRTHDMTGRPKTGDELFSLVKDDFIHIRNTYGVEIISAVTDDGPDGKKMRRLIKEDPELPMGVFECWAHQSNLMTGNYLGVKADFMEAAGKATDIIKWFNNHQKALDLLRNQQNLVLGKVLALIMACSTRWTSQYRSLSRLAGLEAVILGCVAQFRNELVLAGGDKEDAKAKAREIISLCLDSSFWNDLKRIVHQLEPLAIAANIFQAPTCRLDHVLLTLGNIFNFFRNEDDSELGNVDVKKAMESSIERRWGKTDQELFILATFLNPYIRARFFNTDHLNFMSLFHMARRVFQRLTKTDLANDPDFFSAFTDYFNDSGDFSWEAMWLDGFQELFKEKNSDPELFSVDLIKIWQAQKCQTTKRGRGALAELAIHILSIAPNSASTECLFSMFGTTHTKRRNCLSPSKVHKAAVIRMDQNRLFESSKRNRKKRKFNSGYSTGSGMVTGGRDGGGGADDASDLEAAARLVAMVDGGDENPDETPSFVSVSDSLIEAANEEEVLLPLQTPALQEPIDG
ncbi:hypothetical protein EST38_g7244 [Candolleomyces aberdarensis]|uniref:Uncharacterized protein n=1 Tax=Candolleomyces aberdarensis TaxID=2316362 RepID=A0A4V1Q3H5_9AGAR|nr:hypothetical protein EST38_g7244 [Candolleomyces aberdarensis]